MHSEFYKNYIDGPVFLLLQVLMAIHFYHVIAHAEWVNADVLSTMQKLAQRSVRTTNIDQRLSFAYLVHILGNDGTDLLCSGNGIVINVIWDVKAFAFIW